MIGTWPRPVSWVSAAPTPTLTHKFRSARNPAPHARLHVGLRANRRRGRSRWGIGALTQPTVLAVLLLLFPSLAYAAPLKIVASFSILADMVHQVAGTHAEVVTLVGPGGDAHTFDPSPADAGKLTGADLVFVNGLGLDGWMERLAAAADRHGRIVVASTGVTGRRVIDPLEPVPERSDPHAWQDPRNGAIYVRSIEHALEAADPSSAPDFKRDADRLVSDLEALDAETRRRISAIAPEHRKVITSHDAFGYFGAAYGVELLAAEGISTDREPSAGDIARLVDQVRARHIRAVFIETMADPRLIETIRGETGAPDSGALYSDALSPSDGPASTYLAMLRYNADKLIEAMNRN